VDSGSGILVAPRDSVALAKALGDALSRTWDETEISERFRRGWDQVASETRQICVECIRSDKKSGKLPAR
jgi:teichuronic acid biosynthesis glycosyltransferase TuaC